MLLETLDIKTNDILIYSKNYFDPNDNFRVIFKDDPHKRHYKISYNDVKTHLNDFSPKSLIVYRVLTNLDFFDINLAKFGDIILIDGNYELIYLDPVFAIKDIEGFRNKIPHPNFRFRIQQVGLLSKLRKGDYMNYIEIYSFDLEANEAQAQNDKIFADILFSIDKKREPIQAKKEKVKLNKINAAPPSSSNLLLNISEDKKYDPNKFSKTFQVDSAAISNKEAKTKEQIKEEAIKFRKERKTLGDLLSDVKYSKETEIDGKKPSTGSHILDVLKEGSAFEALSQKKDKKAVVLKFD